MNKKDKSNNEAAIDQFVYSVTLLLYGGAFADGKLDLIEKNRIKRSLAKLFYYSEEDIENIMTMTEKRFANKNVALKIKQSALLISIILSTDQQRKILSKIWEIINCDSKIDPKEKYYYHELGRIMGWSNQELLTISTSDPLLH